MNTQIKQVLKRLKNTHPRSEITIGFEPKGSGILVTETEKYKNVKIKPILDKVTLKPSGEKKL